jgi:hypothetical protein
MICGSSISSHVVLADLKKNYNFDLLCMLSRIIETYHAICDLICYVPELDHRKQD